MAIRLSRVSKLDGIRSWSLQALETCPGSRELDTGLLVPSCQGCYARDGNYRFDNVKEPRLENRDDWKRDSWVDDMVSEMDNDRYFRWFDSGDCYDIRLAHKILEVMERTPWVKHWMPTRMHKFDKFREVLADMASLPNVVVRHSSDAVDGSLISSEYSSTITPTPDFETEADKVCPSWSQDGKCKGCRDCWSKDIKSVAYVAHGRVMKSKLKKAGLIAVGV